MAQSIVSLAKELISIPSVSGDIPQAVAVLEVVKKHLTNHEFTPFVSNHFPSLLYSNQGKDTKQFKIILNAHLDIVPGATNQFKPVEKDGRLYGRGAFDMKAAAAVKILLFKDLADKISFPLGLQVTTDEEVSGLDGTGYQIKQGIRGEFIIMGEGNSNFKVTNQSKGRSMVKITINGKSSHSAYPWHGENAIIKLYEVLEPILKAYPVPKEETFDTTVTVTKIESTNTATNKIPDNCRAYLDVRFAQKDKDTIISKIKSLLPDDVAIEAKILNPSHFVNPDNPYITKLKEITKEIHGTDSPLRHAHGASDAIYFAEVGCDAIEFGPIGEGAHEDNEWVDVESLGQYYEILKKFLLSIQ